MERGKREEDAFQIMLVRIQCINMALLSTFEGTGN
ncbi:hypothetical protein J2Z23_004117 [Lederbergia galactosidilyticus]|nr:hypothetical protein [Lederbergia galactosidilytica]